MIPQPLCCCIEHAEGRHRQHGSLPPQHAACKSRRVLHTFLRQSAASRCRRTLQPCSHCICITQQHVTWRLLCSLLWLPRCSCLHIQALSTAATLAARSSGKVTVLTVQQAEAPQEDQAKRSEAITWHLQQAGLTDFEQLTRAADNAPVIIGARWHGD